MYNANADYGFFTCLAFWGWRWWPSLVSSTLRSWWVSISSKSIFSAIAHLLLFTVIKIKTSLRIYPELNIIKFEFKTGCANTFWTPRSQSVPNAARNGSTAPSATWRARITSCSGHLRLFSPAKSARRSSARTQRTSSTSATNTAPGNSLYNPLTIEGATTTTW